MWLTLCQFHNPFEIHYLPVYYPSEDEKADTYLYATNVRKVMSKYLNIPLSNYSFDDSRLMAKFEKFDMPYECGKIKVNQVKKALE
jgi:hypothetical protein